MQEPMESHPDYEPIAGIVASVHAPARLREHVAAEHDRTLIRRTVVKRMKLSGAMAGVAAACGVALALVVPGHAAPSIDDAIALASGTPAGAAPAPVPGRRELLAARVGDVSFPTWSTARAPWKPVGRRDATISGRRAITVFYDNPATGARLGYTIVDGAALAWPSGARTVTSRGIEVHVRHSGGSVVVVWREHGHSCVMAAPDTVPESRMVQLAAAVGRYYA
jgi:hypothetical protein